MTGRATQSIEVHASAKINLTLRVLGIHPDGYHELRTTFQSLALHDTLVFEPVRGPFAISCDSPACPADESNLVWQAADCLWRAGGLRGRLSGVRVHLAKRIPVQAGLGGGSSDAASTLRALRMLWNLRVSDETLQEIARELGADVAFFLEGGTVLGVERGDLLFPLQDTARAWVVLARPDFGVSTRDAYAWWDEAFRAGGSAVAGTRGRTAEWVNDLQAPVASRHPAISRLVGQLKRSGATFAAMSGSGSAVFGLFGSKEAAQAAAGRVAGRRVTTWVTRTTSRREHRRQTTPAGI